jgi:LysM repeat protein
MDQILQVRKQIKMVCLVGWLGLLIVGCSQSNQAQDLTITAEDQIFPYLSATSSSTPRINASTVTPKPSSTMIPSPTATPFVYEVVENDTLIGIAFRHSVPLEEIIAANPEIDPNFLTIGMTLTIPLDGVSASLLPTSTPISIEVQPPVCYRLSDGRTQCMSVVNNDQEFAIENVTVMISLEPSSGSDLQTNIGILPQNIIPKGKRAAVSTYFESTLMSDFTANSSLLSVIPVSADDQRYLYADVDVDEIFISPDGRRANVSGSIELSPDQPNAGTVWVSVFAYDSQDDIVGIRKWISDEKISDPSNRINFKMVVYSLGLPINHVEVLAEVRP